MATKRLPHLRDPIALAKLIGDIAIVQVVDAVEDGKNPAAAKRGRLGGINLRAPAPASAKISDMATFPTLPPIQGRPPSYRLVVKRRTGGTKGYGWEILRDDDETQLPISRSLGAYRTMEEAYTNGSVALAQLRGPERE